MQQVNCVVSRVHQAFPFCPLIADVSLRRANRRGGSIATFQGGSSHSSPPNSGHIAAPHYRSLRAKRRHRTGSLKSANSAKIAHVSECEGKSQKLTSRARLIKAIHDGVVNSLPEILANFRGPVSIGAEYHGNLPQVDLSNQQQLHGGCVGGHEIPLLLYCIDLSDIFPAVPQFHVGRGACQPTRRVGHQQTSLVP